MVNFPLYDNLLSKVKENTRDLSVKQKHLFVENIQKIDKTGLEVIYTLIRVYELKHDKHTSMSDYTLPYDGKYKGKDIEFDFEKFPKRLKRMLFNFLDLHLKTMKEFEKRP